MQLRDEHLRGIELIHYPLGVRIDQLASGGERNAASGALEHAHAEGLLQIRNRAADGGFRHAERARSGGEPIEVYHLGEDGKLRGCPEQVQARAQCLDMVTALFHPGGRKRQPDAVESCGSSCPCQGAQARSGPLSLKESLPGSPIMKVSIHSLAVEQVSHTLGQMLTFLDKAVAYAEAKKFDVSVLVNARLAPDMLPFTKQIQIASDNAKFGVARLAGVDAPKFEDNETTMDELRARIKRRSTSSSRCRRARSKAARTATSRSSVPGRTLRNERPPRICAAGCCRTCSST